MTSPAMTEYVFAKEAPMPPKALLIGEQSWSLDECARPAFFMAYVARMVDLVLKKHGIIDAGNFCDAVDAPVERP